MHYSLGRVETDRALLCCQRPFPKGSFFQSPAWVFSHPGDNNPSKANISHALRLGLSSSKIQCSHTPTNLMNTQDNPCSSRVDDTHVTHLSRRNQTKPNEINRLCANQICHSLCSMFSLCSLVSMSSLFFFCLCNNQPFHTPSQHIHSNHHQDKPCLFIVALIQLIHVTRRNQTKSKHTNQHCANQIWHNQTSTNQAKSRIDISTSHQTGTFAIATKSEAIQPMSFCPGE